MQYIKKEDGSFALLPKQNVDFGGGLERIAMAASGNADIIAVIMGPLLSIWNRRRVKNIKTTYGAFALLPTI